MFLGLVVPCRVDGEFSEDFSCGGVDYVNVVVLNQDDDVGSSVGSPIPMWCILLLTRRVMDPEESARSRRTRLWVSWMRDPWGFVREPQVALDLLTRLVDETVRGIRRNVLRLDARDFDPKHRR